MTDPSDPQIRPRITHRPKVATNYLLIKTRPRWRWLGIIAGLLAAGVASWITWYLFVA